MTALRTQFALPRVGAHDPGLPLQAGIGFKPQHFDALVADVSPPAFVEVHAENYFGDGGLPHRQLAVVCGRVALSVHGVGLSIGGIARPDQDHLRRLHRLLARYPVVQFSEHLAWSSHAGVHYPDLLPLCYDDAALDRVCSHIGEVQDALQQRLLLENPSTYLAYEAAQHAEADFLAEVVRRSGCGLLLDVNNAYVSCHNHGRDLRAYLAALPLQAVGEIHLAGHAVLEDADGGALLVDDHGSAVSEAVWALYREVLARIGPRPTLIEWDSDVPAYPTLRAQAALADADLWRHASERAA